MIDSSGTAAQMIQARTSAAETQGKIQVAIAKKQADSVEMQGDAMVDLIRQAAEMQKQLAAGHIDVRV